MYKGTWSVVYVSKEYSCRYEHMYVCKWCKKVIFNISPVKRHGQISSPYIFLKIYANLHYILV